MLLNETWLISKFPAASTIPLSSSPLTLYFKVVWLLQCLDSKLFISNTIMPGRGFPGGTRGKEPACQCRIYKRHRFDPWVVKIPWRRACNPLQYSCLENPMDRGAWRAAVYGVHTESDMTEVTELTHNGWKISLIAQCFSNCNVHTNHLNG